VTAKDSQPLTLVLISGQEDRVVCIEQDFKAIAGHVRLVVKAPTHKTISQVRRLDDGNKPRTLLMLDFSEDSVPARHLLKTLAFGERRFDGMIAIVTTSTTESILENGELDSGQAIMFSSTDIRSFFSKLGGNGQEEILHSIGVLNQYGPVLIRTHDECAACRKRGGLAAASW